MGVKVHRCFVVMSVEFNTLYYMEMSCSVVYLNLVMTATTGRPNCGLLFAS